jgi:hypothetical protein
MADGRAKAAAAVMPPPAGRKQSRTTLSGHDGQRRTPPLPDRTTSPWRAFSPPFVKVQLTDNALFEGTMTWTPDGSKVIFQSPGGANPTLFYAIEADTTCDTSKPITSSCTCSVGVGDACVRKLTTDGVSLFPHLGQLRVHIRK